METSDINNAFAIFGKIIYISQLADPDAAAYKKAQSATFDQALSGQAEEFDLITDVLVPMHGQTRSTVSTLSQVPKQCQTTLENYLRKIVAPKLELASSASPTEIVTALNDEMVTEAATVLSGGEFAAYFSDKYDVDLNSAGSPTIPDSWIGDTVV